MLYALQHNSKTCIICTGVVWLAIPAAIVLNYHLALIAWCASLNGRLSYMKYG